jgi:hypothetical protein
MQAHRCPVSLSLVPPATAAILILALTGIGAAAEPPAIQPLSRSAVVFMGGSTPELYAAYGATVVDWGGHAWRDQPGSIADFRKRVETAQKMGIQYNAGIGMITEFMGMMDECPEYERAICRDLEGKPITVPWLWDHKYKGKLGMAYWFCSNSPFYQDYLRRRTKLAMAGQPDGYHIDDYGGTTGSLWQGGCFCESCMAGFRQYLAQVAPEKLRGLGIDDLAGFHYGKFLLAKHVKSAAEFRKKRSSMPLDAEFRTFQAKAAGQVVRGLQEYAAQLRGKPLVRCVNGSPTYGQGFVVMPHVDHYSCEIGMGATKLAMTASAALTYKCGDMVDRGIAGTGGGTDWAYAQERQATNLVRYWIAEAYAFGHCFMTPGRHQWAYTQQKGTHHYEGKPENFAFLYQFIRKNARLFDGYQAEAQVVVAAGASAARTHRGPMEAIARTLLDAQVPFCLAAAGDELLALRLDEKRLARFERVIVPAKLTLDAEQQAVLDRLAAQGKLLVSKDGADLLDKFQPWARVEGAKDVWALPRRAVRNSAAPTVVHLLNRRYDFTTDRFEPQKNFVLRLAKPLVGPKAGTRKCTAYTPDGDPVSIPVERDGDALRLKVPELRLWAVLTLE